MTKNNMIYKSGNEIEKFWNRKTDGLDLFLPQISHGLGHSRSHHFIHAEIIPIRRYVHVKCKIYLCQEKLWKIMYWKVKSLKKITALYATLLFSIHETPKIIAIFFIVKQRFFFIFWFYSVIICIQFFVGF